MKVDLVDHMGSDLTVVNAARVSFDKQSSYRENAFGWNLEAADQKLIEYLAKNGHWSPFSHCFLTFRVKAPIFVARQLQKHQVGLAWNEVSRRYVDSEPEFYVPETWRKRADNVKQGSSDEVVCDEDIAGFSEYCNTARWYYQDLLDSGVCPEQARMVLPQSMYTEWYWSGSLYAFSRVCRQRLDSHAQQETQEVARHIDSHISRLFPVSHRALSGNYASA